MGHKTIGILQPVYLPWLGYFEQIARVDHFVFHDDVQYTQRDWRNRNRILSNNGPIWLTVPVKKCSVNTPINEVEISNAQPWHLKHARAIAHNYGRAPFLEEYRGEIERILSMEWERIVDLDVEFIESLCRYLRLDTETSFASDIPPEQAFYDSMGADGRDPKVFHWNMRIIEICRNHCATRFYEGASGAAFIDAELFRHFGIEVIFQEYPHPQYPQCGPGFHSHMSVIDLIMNTGPEARQIILSSQHPFTD
jgi:hypothetical protein